MNYVPIIVRRIEAKLISTWEHTWDSEGRNIKKTAESTKSTEILYFEGWRLANGSSEPIIRGIF